MPEAIRTFGVIGAGIMGRGIAAVAAAATPAFDRVVICDASPAQLDAARKSIPDDLTALVAVGKLDEPGRQEALARVEFASGFPSVAACDFIVEAVPERLEIKTAVFSELGRLAGPGAILASNTSSIPISRLASASGCPERVVGFHFMNPAVKIRGLEVIRGALTNEEVCSAALALAARLGKETVFSRDCAGFVVNRILIPALNDAAAGVSAGLALADAADRHFSLDPKGPRHPMGPLMLADMIGLDTVLGILDVLAAELGRDYTAAPLLVRLVESGSLGAKAGKGFYNWQGGRPRGLNPVMTGLRDEPAAKPTPDGNFALARRVWIAMANEAVRVIDERTAGAADVERGCTACLSQREGLLAALDRFGLAAAHAEMSKLEASLGAKYRPAPLLVKLIDAGLGGKAAGAGFYKWEAGSEVPAGLNPALEKFLG